MKLYVVTHPESIRGIYESWPACEAAVSGVSGAKFQAVETRNEAEAILRGESVTLPLGTYAFIDGNHLGGVGIVFVKQRHGAPAVKEISTSVTKVFSRSRIPSLASQEAVVEALERLRNVLAELAGLYFVVGYIAPGTSFTIVHDYEGIAAWTENRWRAKDPIVHDIVAACQRTISARKLVVAFQHQKGHQSSFVSQNEFAGYNARADALATEGAKAG
jgi:ribonuclease HI